MSVLTEIARVFRLPGQQHLQYCFILVNEDREPRKQTRAVEWNEVQSLHNHYHSLLLPLSYLPLVFWSVPQQRAKACVTAHSRSAYVPTMSGFQDSLRLVASPTSLSPSPLSWSSRRGEVGRTSGKSVGRRGVEGEESVLY